MKRNYMAGIRFSVIVPSFNKADYIRRTIESILHQTYSDYELIVENQLTLKKNLMDLRMRNVK